ncbi:MULTISPECIES: SDR family NAD(P)-dependent oxidoreductase [Rossellomorea]|jgi:NAD(P)-dependent dehydrogenase (short-subunit alcohol dehydrogenase family)|uniref:SDR family NAD(P)-dependent oxidoreductase n=1 Tax=Rossellomorea TaxID=2837508 RepID=UPI0011E8B964|nr:MULTISPECIES: glucose 1-dehydrogenase [Rossellomorea]MDT9024604.1 glucose 1-dehydrogenase [Rossellomorea sp. YC4-1]TYS91866.1 glucose 1-dehydrogenase [Rossellomorea aquimaris]
MYLPSFSLNDKLAVVTGAGRGIGRALSIGLAEAGADVVLLSRTRNDLEDVASEIEKLGRKAYIIPTDITSREEIRKAIAYIEDQKRSIDILINNAGMNIRSTALEVTDQEWQTIMDTNLKSAFMMSQETGKHMKEKKQGKIINIASVAGHVALRTGVVYASTKAAMIQMTKVLAMEWGKYNINVNSIGPWYFKTPLTAELLQNEEYVNDILAVTPLKRIGELEELVGPAVFLSSDASNYVTGQTIFVDGGMTIQGF